MKLGLMPGGEDLSNNCSHNLWKEPYQFLWHFLKTMGDSEGNLLLCHNIHRELKYDNMEEKKIILFLNILDRFLEESYENNEHKKIIDLINHLVYDKNLNIYLLGKIIDNGFEGACHYRLFSYFLKDYMERADIDLRHIDLFEYSENIKDELMNRLTEGIVDMKEFSHIELKGETGIFFWITNSEYTKGKSAQEIFNKLGRYHTKRDLLLEFKLPSMPIKTPTIFDSRLNYFFRPANRKDGWGESLDLSNESNFKGFPEAVSEKISAGDCTGAKIKGEISLMQNKNIENIYSRYIMSEDWWREILDLSKNELLGDGLYGIR